MKLWPGKKTSGYYASFSRRMWAATIDSLLILILVAPVFDTVFDHVYGPPPQTVDVAAFQQRMAELPDRRQQMDFFWQTFKESGMYQRWLMSTTWQLTALCVLTGLCWRRWSSTPGKMLLGLRIVDAETGAPISDRQIVLRILGYFVSTLPLFAGFFWINYSKKHQAWHDSIAGTLVVRESKKEPATPASGAADPSGSPAP